MGDHTNAVSRTVTDSQRRQSCVKPRSLSYHLTTKPKDRQAVLMAFGRLQLCTGLQLAQDRIDAIVTTLRDMGYNDQQIVYTADVLALTLRCDYGKVLSVADFLDVMESETRQADRRRQLEKASGEASVGLMLYQQDK